MMSWETRKRLFLGLFMIFIAVFLVIGVVISVSSDSISSSTPRPTLTYLATPNRISDGDWIVGIDITPDTYQTIVPVSAQYPQCSWTIIRSGTVVSGDLVALGLTPKVTLKDGDEFVTLNCGMWGVVP